MADTQRSKSELDTFFADNVTGLITPAQLRDFMESCSPSFGGLRLTDPGVATTLTAANTWTKCANATTFDQGYRFAQSTNNQLQYQGRVTSVMRVQAVLSVTVLAAAQVLDFAFYKNGVQIPVSLLRMKVTTSGDIASVSLQAFISMVTNDYIELWCQNETSATSITVNHGYLAAQGFLG